MTAALVPLIVLHRLPLFIAAASTAVLLCAPSVSARMLFVPGELVPVSSRPRFMLVDDLDADGFDDVVLVSTRDTVSVLYGSASSQTMFEAPVVTTFGKRLRNAAIGDVTGDGIQDIVVADEPQRGVFVLAGSGARSFGPPRFVGTGVKAYSVAVANIDNMGGADLLVGERRTGLVQVRLNRGVLAFQNGAQLAMREGLEQIACSDINGDHLPELIGISTGRVGHLAIYPAVNDRDAVGYPAATVFNTEANRAHLVTADFDGNGTEDLALLSGTSGSVTSRVDIMKSDADHEFTALESVDVPCPDVGHRRSCRARGLAAADFDGDGVVDLAVGLRNRSILGALGSRRAGIVSFLRGRGDTFVPDGVAPWLERSPENIAAGDFNGDGRPDIVAISKSRNVLQAMLNLSSPGPPVRKKKSREEECAGRGEGCR